MSTLNYHQSDFLIDIETVSMDKLIHSTVTALYDTGYDNDDIVLEIQINIKNKNGDVLHTHKEVHNYYTIYDLNEDVMLTILSYCENDHVIQFIKSATHVTYSDYFWRILFDRVFPGVNDVLKRLGYTFEFDNTFIPDINGIANKDHMIIPDTDSNATKKVDHTTILDHTCIICNVPDEEQCDAVLECGHEAHLSCALEKDKCPICEKVIVDYKIAVKDNSDILSHDDYIYLVENGYIYVKDKIEKKEYGKKRFWRWMQYKQMYDSLRQVDGLYYKIYSYSGGSMHAIDYIMYRTYCDYPNFMTNDVLKFLHKLCNNKMGSGILKHVMLSCNPSARYNVIHSYEVGLCYINYMDHIQTEDIKTIIDITKYKISNKKHKHSLNDYLLRRFRYKMVTSTNVSDEDRCDIIFHDICNNDDMCMSKVYFDVLGTDTVEYIIKRRLKNIRDNNNKISITPFLYHILEHCNKRFIIASLSLMMKDSKLLLCMLGSKSVEHDALYEKIHTCFDKHDIALSDMSVKINIIKHDYIFSSLSREIKRIEDKLKYASETNRYDRNELYNNIIYKNIYVFLTQSLRGDSISEFIHMAVSTEDNMKIHFRLLNILLKHKFDDETLHKIYDDGVVFDSSWHNWNNPLRKYIYNHILPAHIKDNVKLYRL